MDRWQQQRQEDLERRERDRRKDAADRQEARDALASQLAAIHDSQSEMNKLLRRQNSRIDSLEQWREHEVGRREGEERASGSHLAAREYGVSWAKIIVILVGCLVALLSAVVATIGSTAEIVTDAAVYRCGDPLQVQTARDNGATLPLEVYAGSGWRVDVTAQYQHEYPPGQLYRAHDAVEIGGGVPSPFYQLAPVRVSPASGLSLTAGDWLCSGSACMRATGWISVRNSDCIDVTCPLGGLLAEIYHDAPADAGTLIRCLRWQQRPQEDTDGILDAQPGRPGRSHTR
jgi:hypothetical protein